jgi:hypothetical protein
MVPGTPPSPDDFPGLARLLQRRPQLDPAAVELLLVLRMKAGPRFIPAAEFAAHLGLSSRYALVRHLKHLKLPPFSRLHAHVRVLAMLAETKHHQVSLSRLAWCHEGDPASWLRVVKRVTGLSWPELSKCGMAWLVDQIEVRLWGGAVTSREDLSPCPE